MQPSQTQIEPASVASWQPRTTKDRFQNACIMSHYFRAITEQDPENEDLHCLLWSVVTYATQLKRIICNIPATAKDKQDMRDGRFLAADQIREILEDENPLLTDWYSGCDPRNVPQIIMNILTEALDLYTCQLQ